MSSCKNVSAALDDVREARVVDDDRVETLHVEGALAGGGHRQHVRFWRSVLEEGTDHAYRFSAVVELRMNPREPLANESRGFLDSGPRREEHADAALLAHHLLQETIAKEPVGRVGEHLHR